jgi:hypothetical protein
VDWVGPRASLLLKRLDLLWTKGATWRQTGWTPALAISYSYRHVTRDGGHRPMNCKRLTHRQLSGCELNSNLSRRWDLVTTYSNPLFVRLMRAGRLLDFASQDAGQVKIWLDPAHCLFSPTVNRRHDVGLVSSNCAYVEADIIPCGNCCCIHWRAGAGTRGSYRRTQSSWKRKRASSVGCA